MNPFSKGRINQGTGARFEAAIRFMGMREDLLIITNGLRAKRYANKVVAEKSNVDFLILGNAKESEVAFFDAKSFQGKRFGRSQLPAHQQHICLQYCLRGFPAGFLVHLREIDFVGFYSADVIAGGADRQGFGPDNGLHLGALQDFSLLKIWHPEPP